MLPVSLLLWIVFEAACYLGLGRHFLHLDWPGAAIGAVGGILGLRAGISAVGWLFAAAFASPAPPLATGQRLRLIVEEYLAFLFTFLVVIPCERLWQPPDRLQPGRPVLLLVHGYGCSRGVWWLLRRRLEAAGHTVATVNLAPPYTAIGRLVPQLNERIEAVRAATGCRRLTLVAHSMGGLVCRSYLARHGHQHVERLVTLATPHAGSELARIGVGQNAREMTPDSLWLRDMANENPGIPVVCLRNPYDNYVMPQNNQRLPGARDVELPVVGHLAMLYDRRVARLVLDACPERTTT